MYIGAMYEVSEPSSNKCYQRARHLIIQPAVLEVLYVPRTVAVR